MSDRFTRDDVERVAQLARLELTPEEKDLLARQLADILAYARQVQDVDTTGVPPTSHALADKSSMRDDVVAPSLAREDALTGAPGADATAGLFKVPRVLG
jgi:aspartyl-tRNA(Asn)/glutamyl-tRNA(Gln) amidotransferase subunit C